MSRMAGSNSAANFKFLAISGRARSRESLGISIRTTRWPVRARVSATPPPITPAPTTPTVENVTASLVAVEPVAEALISSPGDAAPRNTPSPLRISQSCHFDSQRRWHVFAISVIRRRYAKLERPVSVAEFLQQTVLYGRPFTSNDTKENRISNPTILVY